MQKRSLPPASFTEDQWPTVLAAFPSDLDLDTTARESRALVRRRGVPSAEALLRLALMYGPGGLSLRGCAAWATATGVAELSDVSLMERLIKARPWLEDLVCRLLAARVDHPASGQCGRSLRIADGTCISGPGSKGTDWRLHALYTLGRGFTHLEVSDAHGAESLRRGPVEAGEIRLADRGFAKAKDLCALLDAGADYVTRIGWRSLKLRQSDATAFNLIAALKAMPAAASLVSHEVVVEAGGQTGGGQSAPRAVRLLVARKPPEAADQERRRIGRNTNKKQVSPNPNSLIAAGFVMILTSLPAQTVPAEEVMALYRLRWQVEIAFKRLKSLLRIGDLPAKGPELARSWIAAHLIAALLLDTMTQDFLDSPPCGGLGGGLGGLPGAIPLADPAGPP